LSEIPIWTQQREFGLTLFPVAYRVNLKAMLGGFLDPLKRMTVAKVETILGANWPPATLGEVLYRHSVQWLKHLLPVIL
jgi:hypothetical protein